MSDTETKKGKTYEERVKAVNCIAQPLASKKSTKKAHKLVKKADLRRGVKEVIKGKIVFVSLDKITMECGSRM